MIPIHMMMKVMPISGHEARLWKNGMRRVRIMCTISVCDNRPSINQPDWNRV